MTYQGLLFSYRRTVREIELASEYFRKYVASETIGSLDEWCQKMRAFKQGALRGTRTSWQIPLERPLRTVVSRGQYHPGNNGTFNVIGTVSSIWEIEHVGKHASVPRNDEVFRLVDDGSTLVKILRIHDDSSESCIAAWRFDVGVAASPGFHFHSKVETWPDAPVGQEQIYFPRTLDVPRFPSLLFFPLDALEYLLGELFQENWPPHAVSEAMRMGFFEFQTGRLKNLLKEWGFVTQSPPPLLTLRRAKPSEIAFLA